MKPAATYVARPVAVRAIQLPPAGEDPTDDYITSLHELLAEFDWESGRNGELTVYVKLPANDDHEEMNVPMTASPGDWIIVEGDCVLVASAENFQRNYQEPSDIAHLTTP